MMDCIEGRVTSKHNLLLTQEFICEDVKSAIFSMHPNKNPDLDGMNPAFFQNFGKIIGSDISKACLSIISSMSVPQNLNDTLVVLILKKNSPKVMNDVRPISLCNVMMRIITKMFANRLKMVLPRIKSETQSAFISGRLITNNVIAAFEINRF